jgi:hypothetical protein
MKVLFDDIFQIPENKNVLPRVFTQPQARFLSAYSDAVSLAVPGRADCIGLAGFQSTQASFTFVLNDSNFYTLHFEGNGLYPLPAPITVSRFKWIAAGGDSAAKFGRIGMGVAKRMRTAVVKPLGYRSSASPEFDGAGALVTPRGAYKYRTLSLECRYTFTRADMAQIQENYLRGALGEGMPLFFDLADEAYKLPFSKFYAVDQNIDNFNFSNERGIISGSDPVHFSHTFDLRECL